MTAQHDKLVVSQEAREAAWSAARETPWFTPRDRERMMHGESDDNPLVQAFQRAMNQSAQGARQDMRETFLPAVLHGDETHRAWLTAAVDAYIAGKPVPPPTGKGNTQAAIEDAVRRTLERAAEWHDRRAKDTPDAFEQEFHEVSATAIRGIDPSSILREDR